jgi:hypothetical protein
MQQGSRTGAAWVGRGNYGEQKFLLPRQLTRPATTLALASCAETDGPLTTSFSRGVALDELRVLSAVAALWSVKFAHPQACEGNHRS